MEPGDAPVIYVNSALKGAGRCDYWACWDSPNEIHEVAFPDAHRLGPILLCGAADSGLAWRDMMMASKMWPWKDWMTIVAWPRPLRPEWFNRAANGPNYSAFSALSYAISRGAKRIEVFGADMTGVGYNNEEASRCERAAKKAPHRWETRWTKERTIFNAIQGASRGMGIEIVRL